MASPNLPPVNSKEFKLYKSFVEDLLKRTGGSEIRIFKNNKIYKNSYFIEKFKDFNEIIKNNLQNDIIITYNKPKRKDIKLKDEDFERYLYIFIDLDFKQHSEDDKLFFSKEVLELVLYELNINYCYKAKGRGGYHYLIPVDLVVSEDNKEKIKFFLDLLKNKCLDKISVYYGKDSSFYDSIIDTVVINPSRLIRCPNTYNYKTEKPFLNQILEFYHINDEDIKINSDFIENLKIEKKKFVKTDNDPTQKQSNKGFFEHILTNETLWQSLYKDWLKADERYTVFIKNLSAFVKNCLEYKERAYNFLEAMDYLKVRKSQIIHIFEKDDKISNINLLELYKWSNKYNLTTFKELLLKYIDNQNIIYTSKDGNFRIIYNTELSYYELEYLKIVNDNEIWQVWGAFKDIKKIKKHIYNINSSINYEVKDIVIIETVNTQTDKEPFLEYILNHTEFISIGKSIKISSIRDDFLYNYYKEFYKWIISLDYLEEYYTNCYGFFGEDKIFLPNKYNLLAEDLTPEANSFIEFHKSKIETTDLKKIGSLLREYLEHSKFSQIIFAYSLISPFRYYLMGRGLKEFGYLGVRGRSGIGKSTRIKILCNSFHSNYNSEGHSEDLLQSLFRFSSLQNILTPLVLDDPRKIDNNIISIMKELGTSKVIDTFKGTSSQRLRYYRFIRPVILSFNNLILRDTALINRFMFLNLDDTDINYSETIPNEELILKLEHNIHILGKFYWENINHFYNILSNLNFDTTRTNSKLTILKLGFIIMNEFFKLLEVEQIQPFKISDYLSTSDNFIYDEKDEFLSILLDNLKNLTKTNIRFEDTVSEYNIFNLNIDNFDNIKYKPLFDKCINYGLYIDNSNNLVLTSKTLTYLNLKGYKINKLTDFLNYLNQNICSYKLTRVLGEDNPVRGVILKLSNKIDFEDEQPIEVIDV